MSDEHSAEGHIKPEDVCILVPALNEEGTVGEVVHSFQALGFSDILVVDGHSSDNTVKVAEQAGARVIVQPDSGKGNAVVYGLEHIDKPYGIMVDADGTYVPEDALRLLDKLAKGYDHVIGNRLENYEKGAFGRLNFWGNLALNRLFSMVYGAYFRDILSGYRAFTTESLRKLRLGTGGFEVETEIAIYCVKHGLKVGVIPVGYLQRKAPSKLNPLADGIKIGATMYRLALGHNPLFYFGMFGLFFALLGIMFGVYVVHEWFGGIEHLPMTMLSVALLLMGVQVFVFGVLANLIVGLHRELVDTLSELRDEIMMLSPRKKK